RLPYTTKINWDPVKDLSYVINLAGYSFGLVVPADSPIKTMQEYIAYAKANPGKLTYGSPGSMTTLHLTMEDLAMRQGVQFSHIPYKGADALNDLLSGRIQFMFATIPSVMPHIQAGKLRALAVSSAKRSRSLPDLPTVAEKGYPGFEAGSWFGFFAPKGTPQDVITKVNQAVNEALAAGRDTVAFCIRGAGAGRVFQFSSRESANKPVLYLIAVNPLPS
ncbi:UNVERIFIED_CONTAM: tripartite tricarboxylate transporter substrate binding protein, partial [Microbacterium sp. SLM126]